MRAWLLVLVLLASASQVDAECATRTATSPNGSAVPLEGVVFASADAYAGWTPPPPELAWERGTGTTKVTKLSESVTRVEYAGADGAVLRVDHTHYDLSSRAPSQPLSRVVAMARHKGSWTCSSHDVLAIELSDAPAAVRARWTREAKVFEYWLVPEYARVELGKADCGAANA